MRIESGDIWSFWRKGFAVVIPGNIGWTRSGDNVMGRGVAAQARDLYPTLLPKQVGAYCRANGANTGVCLVGVGEGRWFIFFPVKPLNVHQPWLSWKGPATLDLVRKSAQELANIGGVPDVDKMKFALPLVGCGNGGLDPDDVIPILAECLKEDRFVLVIRE